MNSILPEQKKNEQSSRFTYKSEDIKSYAPSFNLTMCHVKLR